MQNSTNLFILGGDQESGQPLNVPYTTRVNLAAPSAINWTALTPNLPGNQRIYQSVLATVSVTGSTPTTYFVYAGGIFVTNPEPLPLNDVWSAVAQGGPVQPGGNQYTFCVRYSGVRDAAVDTPYSISLLVSGTYNTTLLTSTAGRYTPSGQYYNLLTANGTRTTRTRYNSTNVNTILSLVPLGSVDNNNRFYISNATFPQFVDADGIAVNFSIPVPYPGQAFSSYSNLYRSGVYGPLIDYFSASENYTTPSVSALITGWTGAQYVPGSCVPPPLTPEIRPVKPVAGVYNVTLFYNISGISTPTTSWNVVTNVVFHTNGVIYGPDVFEDFYFQLNTTRGSSSGTRTYCIRNGTVETCGMSTITQALPISLFADNRVYTYSPYLDSNGIAYEISPAQPLPGFSYQAPAANFTIMLNPYISPVTGLGLLEGFFADRFGPDGPPTDSVRVNTSLTKFTISVSRA